MESGGGLREDEIGGRVGDSRGRKWWMEMREKEVVEVEVVVVEDKNGEWRTELSMDADG